MGEPFLWKQLDETKPNVKVTVMQAAQELLTLMPHKIPGLTVRMIMQNFCLRPCPCLRTDYCNGWAVVAKDEMGYYANRKFVREEDV